MRSNQACVTAGCGGVGSILTNNSTVDAEEDQTHRRSLIRLKIEEEDEYDYEIIGENSVTACGPANTKGPHQTTSIFVFTFLNRPFLKQKLLFFLAIIYYLFIFNYEFYFKDNLQLKIRNEVL